MRKRDKVFAVLAWGGLLGGLAWALTTQFRWVRENRPIEVRPSLLQGEPEPKPEESTGVIGTVTEDARAAMAREQAQRKAKKLEKRRPSAVKPAPER